MMYKPQGGMPASRRGEAFWGVGLRIGQPVTVSPNASPAAGDCRYNGGAAQEIR